MVFTERQLKRLPIVRKKADAVVEMECAALAAVALASRSSLGSTSIYSRLSSGFRKIYDSRDWGSEAFDKALELCLEIVSHM